MTRRLESRTALAGWTAEADGSVKIAGLSEAGGGIEVDGARRTPARPSSSQFGAMIRRPAGAGDGLTRAVVAWGVSGAPDTQVLSVRVAVLKERMNTMQADLSATLERFRADMAAHRKDAATREPQLLTVIVATVIGTVGVAVAFLRTLIGVPS